MEVWQGWFLVKDPPKTTTPAVNAAKRAVDAGIAPEGQWLPGMPAPFVAIARVAGKTAIIGRYATAIEAAAAYDEVANISGLPTNNITYEELKQAREEVQQNAVAVFANEIQSRGVSLSKRARSKASEEVGEDGKKVAFAKITRDEVRALKADRKKMEKYEKQLDKHKARAAKAKAKEDERKAKKQAKKEAAASASAGKKRKAAPKKGGAAKKKAKASEASSNLHEV